MLDSRDDMTGQYSPYDATAEHWEDRRAHTRISQLEVRLNSIEQKLDLNTAATETIAANTTELVTLVKGAKGFRNFLLWVAPIGAAGAVTWSIVKDHWK